MMDQIINLLNKNEKISAWTITESISKSSELFFIKNKLDMNRATNIHEYTVKIFVDFKEENEKYKGDASFLVSAEDSIEEIDKNLQRAILSASFVKNKWYDLAEKDSNEYISIKEYKNIDYLLDNYDKVYDIFFKEYEYESKLNSVEIFAKEAKKRVVTSKGIDVSYPNDVFTFELVTDNNNGQEPVEIFKDYTLTNIDINHIEEIIKKQLLETDGRAKAKRHEKIDSIRLILSGDAVEELLQFYLFQAYDYTIYNKMSRLELGKNFVEENSRQNITIKLNPALESSVFARPVDDEGKQLKAYTILEDGLAKNLRTSSRYSHYLGVENRGLVNTFEVQAGQKPLNEYLNEDYIEILTFSSFLMDPVTGDFGGEFRLARLVKDGKEEFITGGAISENIFKQQAKMAFSKELEKRKLSISPKAIIFDDIAISGD